MKTLKRFLVTATIVGLVAAVPSIGSAQPIMGPGMGYENMDPGMMGGYGMGPGMMGGYGVWPGMMDDCGMGSRMMGPGMTGGYGMGPGMMGLGMMWWGPYSGVNLTDEQNTKIAGIQEEFSKKQWDVMNQMRDEQFKLQQLYSVPKRDNAAINEQFSKINQLRRQMWDGMADARKKTEAVLTNEQRNAMRRWSGPHMMRGW
ncbi:MAG: Spy/CpxP family protein refolding chaperone [Betaproteobacteria bacterium]|nr:Spy/CpxP family protein refolding chaperone [Betaproteobacteria bacterium]